MTAHFARELRFGAHYIGGGRTRFRFWAPGQKQVRLELNGAAAGAMAAAGGGWFELNAAARPGAAYRYILDDGTAVPDPASRAQQEDVHGPSLVVDPRAYEWRHAEWRGLPWRDTVLYELHAGLLGGFAGVTKELPRLRDLGVTAIELMPINDFPGKRNWGYDGVLPYAPDRAYGTPDELKALIDTAHGLGLTMFLDVVYNHFGPDGNYLGLYAPQVFHRDKHSGWGAALDFTIPELRQFFTDNAIYWLMEYRFDGLRFDAVHAIGERSWLEENADAIRRVAEPGRHVHLVLENDRNDARLLGARYDAQWNDDGHHVLHVLLSGEGDGYYGDYADRPAERLARCLREGFVYQGEPSPYRDGAPRGESSASLCPTCFVLFLQNHDQIGNRPFGDRLTRLAAPEAIEAALALILLSPQIPLLFMGEEQASETPFLFFTDHHGDLADKVREGRRKEFAGFAGFSDPAKRAAIPDPNAEQTYRDSLPRPDADRGAARFALVQRLLRLRRERIAPRLDGARAVKAEAIGPAAVFAEWQLGAGCRLAVLTNLGADAVAGVVPEGTLLFESRDGAAATVTRDGELTAFTTIAYFAEPQ